MNTIVFTKRSNIDTALICIEKKIRNEKKRYANIKVNNYPNLQYRTVMDYECS